MAARKKLDLLTAVEQIVEKAKGTGLSSDFYRKADKYINVSSTNSKQCKLCVHNSFTCNAWFLWEEAVSG